MTDSDNEGPWVPFLGEWKPNFALPRVSPQESEKPYIQQLIDCNSSRPFANITRASIMGTLLPHLDRLEASAREGATNSYEEALAATHSAHGTISVLLMWAHFPNGIPDESASAAPDIAETQGLTPYEQTLISYVSAKLDPSRFWNAGEFPMLSPYDYQELSTEVSSLCENVLSIMLEGSTDITFFCQGTPWATNWADHITEHRLTAAIIQQQLADISESLSKRASDLTSAEEWVQVVEDDKERARDVLPGNDK